MLKIPTHTALTAIIINAKANITEGASSTTIKHLFVYPSSLLLFSISAKYFAKLIHPLIEITVVLNSIARQVTWKAVLVNRYV